MVMRFDSEREKDIIDYLRKLASQHRLGEFLASLVRAALSDDGKRSKESFEVALDMPRGMEFHGKGRSSSIM